LGSSFCVKLPVSAVRDIHSCAPRQHPRDTIRLASSHAPLDLSGLTLLVVDDDMDARELTRRVLSECDARVLVAADAAEAIDLVEQHRPDVLVSDIGMPEVDGFELLRRIRALGADRGGGVPAIALTAFARSEDRTLTLRSGFMAHLSKPVEPPELMATVASAAGSTGALAAAAKQHAP
jgi:CheY-like chemotaxis protein